MTSTAPIFQAFASGPLVAVTTVPVGRPITNPATAAALFSRLACRAVEQVHFAYLDPQWRLLGLRETESERAQSVAVPLKLVVADALRLGATRVLMAHNHPSGDPTPSGHDLASTRRIARALALVEVRLVDHLVMARGGTTSLHAMGLL